MIKVEKVLAKIKMALELLKGGFNFVKKAYADTFRLALNPIKGAKSLYGISFYRNAVYLMANSAISALLGFFFWILVAHLYSAEDVGLGSALISAAGLLSFIGTLGLGFGIIRFLPHSNDKAWLLNSSFTISFLASTALALTFLAGLSFWSPKLMFVRGNPIFFIAFVVFVSAATLNGILSSTFIGFLRAEFTLLQGVVGSLLKLLLAVALASFFKVFGIFASWGIAVVVALVVSLFVFLPRLLPRYRPIPSLPLHLFPVSNPQSPIPVVLRFSFANYIGMALWGLHGWVLPLMVLGVIGAEANAYFYIAWAMAGLLLTIPMTTSTSLFAESSYREEMLGENLKRSLKLIALILIPAVFIFILVGDKLLLLFGKKYSEAGVYLLWLLSLAAIPASINLLYLGIAQVRKKLKEIILITAAIAFGALVLSYFLLPLLGILGAGVGWLIAHLAVSLAISLKLLKGM